MYDCPFCRRIAAGDFDHPFPGNGRQPIAVSFVPLNPVVHGHRLFIPTLHITHATENPGHSAATLRAALRWASLWENDYNLILNQGASASQTVDHMHLHYVPRQLGDGLHLPWTGQHVA